MVQQYLDHSREILTSEDSDIKGGSKGANLISLRGYTNRYDLRKGFPQSTTKKMPYKSGIHELIWFMKGDTNIKPLVDNGIGIWNRDAFNHNLQGMAAEKIFPKGLVKYSEDWHKALNEYVQRVKEDPEFAIRWADLGPIYGAQWRRWKSPDGKGGIKVIDQLSDLVANLRKHPTGKKHIVSAWNPGDIPDMALEPCHVLFKAGANEEGELDLLMYQRSCDQFLGVPFNIASYAMLTIILAQNAGLKPRRFIHSFDDAHFYCGAGERAGWYKNNFQELQNRLREVKKPEDYLAVLDWVNKSVPPEPKGTEGLDHVTAILEQLSREPRPLPRMTIANKPFDQLTIDDFVLEGYDPHPPIKRAMAV